VGVALAVGIAGMVLGAASMVYILAIDPHAYVAKHYPSTKVVLTQTVAAVSGDPANGYAGFLNFTVPGASGRAALVQIDVSLPQGCGSGTAYCFVALTQSSVNSSISPYVLVEFWPGGSTQGSVTGVVPCGTVMVLAANTPSNTFYGNAGPFSADVSVTYEGLIVLQ
jgi:hypothetical protein